MGGRLSALLFTATVLTTTLAGSWLAGADPFSEPLGIFKGAPFAAALLAILGAHEMAHYLTARRYGVRATWPFFIPAPIPPVGTFGALIRIKSVIPDRRALIEIGSAGPLAGFLVALPMAIGGLLASHVEVPEPGGEGAGIYLGTSLIFRLLEEVVLGRLPENAALILNPVAFAAWFGFFVTAMNLLPIGQLDGGHVLYALFGGRRKSLGRLFLLLLIPLGFFWPGWLFWGGLMCVIGFRHPPVLREDIPLGARQKVIGLLAAVVLTLTFLPAPFIF